MTERTTRSRCSGMSIVDLILVLLIILALIVLVLPQLKRVRGGPRHGFTSCRGNLKGIGTAMLCYREENRRHPLPLIKLYEAVPSGANSAPTEANQTDQPFSSGQWESTLGDQAMQNVWLLVAAKLVDDEMFRCSADGDYQPRDGLWKPRDDLAKYGWTDPHQYSYGMQWPYQKDVAGNANPAPLGAPDTVMLADRNPGGPVGRSRPPSNHSKYGTNCLLSDGSVTFSPREGFPRRTVSTLGFEGDEIYTNAAGVAGGLPQHDEDTSIALSGR